MNLHIRDARAIALAEKLAEQKGVSVDEAVVGALEAQLNERSETLAEFGNRLAEELKARGKPGGRDLTKEEIDQLWGHD